MKVDKEITEVFAEAQQKPQNGKVAGHVTPVPEKSGEIVRVKSDLSMEIEKVAAAAAAAANDSAWNAGLRSILRSAVTLIGEGRITKTSFRAAMIGTKNLQLRVTSANEENAIEIPGVKRYFIVGENPTIFDALKTLGNVTRAFNVRYYSDGSAKSKEEGIKAKLAAAAAAAEREAKRLQLIEARAAAVANNDFEKAYKISMEIESL